MNSLEVNFPHLLPKALPRNSADPLQDPPKAEPPPFRLRGERGLASDEVLNPGNQTQCNQLYLDGLLLGLSDVKSTIIKNPTAFGLGDVEAFDTETEDFVLDASDNLNEITAEYMRLRSHPELFGDNRVQAKFLEAAVKALKYIRDLLSGRVQMKYALKREAEGQAKAEAEKKSTAEMIAPAPSNRATQLQPWQTWCGDMTAQGARNIPQLKDFIADHPDMVLVGAQLVPHMGVLIAEHWRMQVEDMMLKIAAAAESASIPNITDQTPFPEAQKMVRSTNVYAGGKFAVLKFEMPQPAAAHSGHIFAFGPQKNIADMARFMAHIDQDVTSRGHPRSVMIGTFLTKEEAKKLPHLRPMQ